METFSALLAFFGGTHRQKGQWRGALMFSLIWALNKRLSKQSSDWWFETPSRSFWRNYNDMARHVNKCLLFWSKTHQGMNNIVCCWSLRCSWSIACQRCSNYIFILAWRQWIGQRQLQDETSNIQVLWFWCYSYLWFGGTCLWEGNDQLWIPSVVNSIHKASNVEFWYALNCLTRTRCWINSRVPGSFNLKSIDVHVTSFNSINLTIWAPAMAAKLF